jgi:glycosyltransferase involved in cell wall biosynthesis
MLRILFVINVLAVGGSEMFLLRQIQRLRKRGHFAALAYSEITGENTDTYLREYLENRDVFHIQDMTSIDSIVRECGIQVVHAVQAHPRFLRRAKELNSRIVCVAGITADVSPADKNFNHRLYTDAIVTYANAFLPYLQRNLSKSSCVVVIENGIDVDRFSPENPNTVNPADCIAGVPVNKKLIVQIGRIHPKKNIEGSMKIARKICDVREDCAFLFIGGRNQKLPESYYNELLALREKLDLSGSYYFLGGRSDIRNLLSIATCVLCTTRTNEGTPNALLEALSMGRPVVALECDGIRDVVRHGETGFVAKDIPSAVTNLLQLLDDFPLRKRMSAAARSYAKERFDLNVAVDHYERLYKELMMKGSTLRRRALIRFLSFADSMVQKILSPILHRR